MAIDPIQGLIDYVNEVKPFHTKILEVAVAYSHNDDVNITITEDLQLDVALFWPAIVGSPDEGPIRVCTAGYGVEYDRATPYIIVDANISPQTISLEGNYEDAFAVGSRVEIREPYTSASFASPITENTPRVAIARILSVAYDSSLDRTVLGIVILSEDWLGSPIRWVGSPQLSIVRDGILAIGEGSVPHQYYSNNGATIWNTSDAFSTMGSPQVGSVLGVQWMDNIDQWVLVAYRAGASDDTVVWTTTDPDPSDSSVWTKVYNSTAGNRAGAAKYANGRLVFTAWAGQMFYTDDLINFNSTTWSSANTITSLDHWIGSPAIGSPTPGYWVCGGGNGDGAFSTDNGVTWTDFGIVGAGYSVNDLQFGTVEGANPVGRVIAATSSAGFENRVYTCDDITNGPGSSVWTARTALANNNMTVLGRNWNTGTMIAQDANGGWLRSTDNGTTWLNTLGESDSLTGSPQNNRFAWPGGGVAYDITFDNASKKWVAVGEQSSYPAIWTSSDDGVNWIQVFNDGSPLPGVGEGIFRVGIKGQSTAANIVVGSPFLGSPLTYPSGSPPFGGDEFWFRPYDGNQSNGDVFAIYDVVSTNTLQLSARNQGDRWYIDNFIGSSGAPISSDWADIGIDGYTKPVIVDGTTAGQDDLINYAGALLTKQRFDPNHFAELTILSNDTDSLDYSDGIWVWLRATSTPSGYYGYISPGGSPLELSCVIARWDPPGPGSPNRETYVFLTDDYYNIPGAGAGIIPDGTKIRLEAEGTTLSLYIDGVLVSTVTDSLYLTEGSVGFGLDLGNTADDYVVDIFKAGDIIGSPRSFGSPINQVIIGSPFRLVGSPVVGSPYTTPTTYSNTITIKSTTPDIFLYGQEIEIRNATNTDLNRDYNIFNARDLGGSPNLVELTVIDDVLADTTNDGELLFTPDGFSGGDICGDVPPEILQTHWLENLDFDWRFIGSPLGSPANAVMLSAFQHFILAADSVANTIVVQGDVRYILTDFMGSPISLGSPNIGASIQHARSVYGSPFWIGSPYVDLNANNGPVIIQNIVYDASVNESTLTLNSVAVSDPTGWIVSTYTPPVPPPPPAVVTAIAIADVTFSLGSPLIETPQYVWSSAQDVTTWTPVAPFIGKGAVVADDGLSLGNIFRIKWDGSGRWIAVGDPTVAGVFLWGSPTGTANADGTIITSDDEGLTWNRRTPAAQNTGSPRPLESLNGVAYNGTSTWVVVGNVGEVWTSADNGTTWTHRKGASGTTASLTDVEWTGSEFVAVGSNQTIISSTDGITWTPIQPGSPIPFLFGSTDINTIAFNSAGSPTRWFIGTNTSGSPVFSGSVWHSDDRGVTWNRGVGLGSPGSETGFDVQVYDIAVNPTNNTVLAVTQGFGDPVYVSSNNGASWRSVNVDGAGSPFQDSYFYAAEYSSDYGFLISGTESFYFKPILYSGGQDALTWTMRINHSTNPGWGSPNQNSATIQAIGVK